MLMLGTHLPKVVFDLQHPPHTYNTHPTQPPLGGTKSKTALGKAA